MTQSNSSGPQDSGLFQSSDANHHDVQCLIHALRTGDSSGANLLNHQYRDALIRFCWGYLGRMDEAEDAAQEICIKIVKTGTSIPDYFRPWVYKIARNHCLNLLRSKNRRREKDWGSGASQVCDALTGNLTRLARDEIQSKLIALVHALPEDVQEILRLRYAEELSRTDIAQVLDVSESLVKRKLFEGLKTLRTQAQQIDQT